ncbi:hypothetical protein ExPCM14_00112 [Escherichia coli]|nr:hypothetical protein ExPCM14_00112 [Escherichia coli]
MLRPCTEKVTYGVTGIFQTWVPSAEDNVLSNASRKSARERR